MLPNKSKLGFPVDYGDSPLDNEDRLSVRVVEGIKSKRFWGILSGLFSVILIIGSNARSTNAISLEAGESIAQAAAEAASEMPQGVPTTLGGTAAGRAAGASAPAPLPAAPDVGCHNRFGRAGLPGALGTPGGPGGPPSPGQPPVMIGIPRPATPILRTGNTLVFAGSIGWICLNAYWGNTVAIIGFSAMVGGWFLSVLGVKLGS
jgi:hypothetical protein